MTGIHHAQPRVRRRSAGSRVAVRGAWLLMSMLAVVVVPGLSRAEDGVASGNALVGVKNAHMVTVSRGEARVPVLVVDLPEGTELAVNSQLVRTVEGSEFLARFEVKCRWGQAGLIKYGLPGELTRPLWRIRLAPGPERAAGSRGQNEEEEFAIFGWDQRIWGVVGSGSLQDRVGSKPT